MFKKIFYVLLLLSITLQATVPNEQNVAKLYIATFKRAPDAAGLKYWLDDSGLTLEEIAKSFFEQSETRELYPERYSEQDFIRVVYKNLFNRIPDAAGADYWLKELSAGNVSRDIFILAAINGALGEDVTILKNKMTVGLAFAHAGMNNINDAIAIMSGITASSSSVEEALEDYGLKTDAEHTVPKPEHKPQPSATPNPVSETAQKGWYIRINVQSDKLQDNHTVFGYLDGASDGKDKYDSKSLGSQGLYTTIYHEAFEGGKEYRSDYRANKRTGSKTETWILKVNSGDASADITMSWNGITVFQGLSKGGYLETHKSSSHELENMILIDVESKEIIDISIASSYSFNMNGKKSKEFKWMMLADDEETPAL